MTEEVNTQVETPEVPETPQYSEIEQKALELGWRPKEEFHGTEDEFIDAKEFVRRQPLFEKISHQTREIKDIKRALEAFKTHYTAVKEVEYNRALASLKAARKEALSDADGERFEAIDTEIKNVESQVDALKEAKGAPTESAPEEHPQFTAWKNQNRWYETTGYMRAFADEYGIKLRASGMSPENVLKEVAIAVKKEFPHKFQNPNKNTAPHVGVGDSSGGNSKKSSSIEQMMPELDRKMMNDLVRSGALTKEKYIADWKAINKIT